MQHTMGRTPQDDAGAPPMVRRALLALVALVGAGACYLVAVRGEALLADLAAIGSKVWCF